MLEEQILKKAKKKTHDAIPGRYWATIASMECPVDMYGRFCHGTGLADDVLLRMARGTAIHKGLEEFFDDTEMSFEIELPNFTISGRIDGVLGGRLYEIKTYAVMRYVPMEIYKNQVEIYLRALQYDARLGERLGDKLKDWDTASLGLINMSTFKEKVIDVTLSDTRWKRIVERTQLLHNSLEGETKPVCTCGHH